MKIGVDLCYLGEMASNKHVFDELRRVCNVASHFISFMHPNFIVHEGEAKETGALDMRIFRYQTLPEAVLFAQTLTTKPILRTELERFKPTGEANRRAAVIAWLLCGKRLELHKDMVRFIGEAIHKTEWNLWV